MCLIGGFIIVGGESFISPRRLVDIVLIIRTLFWVQRVPEEGLAPT
jgi:hypothetical protein